MRIAHMQMNEALAQIQLNGLDDQQKAELLPDGLILLGYRGSIAHGMHIASTDPDSIDDIDLMGVYVAPIEHYLGFGRPDVKERFIGQFDSVCYEVRKIIGLLLKGNPNVLSLLWLPEHHILFMGLMGEYLRAHKKLFVSRKAYNAFTGYAYGQLKRMTHLNKEALDNIRYCEMILKNHGLDVNDIRADQEMRDTNAIGATGLHVTVGGVIANYDSLRKKYYSVGYLGKKRRELVERFGFDAKNAAHLIRLLRMGIEFLRTGELEVERRDAEELLEIKRGEWTLERVKAEAEKLFAASSEAHSRSKLPDEPDSIKAERVCRTIISTYHGLE